MGTYVRVCVHLPTPTVSSTTITLEELLLLEMVGTAPKKGLSGPPHPDPEYLGGWSHLHLVVEVEVPVQGKKNIQQQQKFVFWVRSVVSGSILNEVVK